ncbi:MAG: metallophosphoesterase [Candidatus Delongbacteria bacterium]|nr:metallophosphoesterase [Candidatus Delongbacteria bacterium]
MNKDCILHISDLHIDNMYDDDGNIHKESWINSKPEYINVFIKNLKKILSDEKLNPLALVISGDLSNVSEEEEYKRVSDFLRRFIDISFQKDNFLIIPGNHDINWDNLKSAFKQYRKEMSSKGSDWKMGRKPYSFHSEKFMNFSNFYNTFFDKKPQFNPENAVVDSIFLSDYNLLLIGLNSIFQESHIGEHFGWIEKSKLEQELTELVLKYPDAHKIGILHHNIASFDSTNSRYLKNWGTLRNVFIDNNVHTFFFGHQHSSGSKSESYGEIDINFSEVGSFAKKESVSCSFNLYVLENEVNCLNILRKPYVFIPSEQDIHDETGFWNFVKDGGKSSYILCNPDVKTELVENEPNSQDLTKDIPETTTKPLFTFKETEVLKNYSNSLFNIIKNHKAYKTGHFHWTEFSRTLNWLDTSIIFKTNKYLSIAKAALNELILSNSINYDIAIGLGIEGNLLSAHLSYYSDAPYTFIPHIYRELDHIKSEKKLKYSNHKSVLIIDQIVHKASSIKRLIENEVEFFHDVEKIYLVTLFYSGEKTYNPNMFHGIDKRIAFYMVCDKLTVYDCPRQKDYECAIAAGEKCNNIECMEYNSKLNEVIEFYSKVDKNENN